MSVTVLKSEQLPSSPPFDAFRRTAPDWCLIAGESHCGIWLARAGKGRKQYGMIGHYAARNSQESQRLLHTACGLLQDKGCVAVYGPMNGNTWQSYRFVTWSDGSPPFLMEPHNPPQWPEYWLQAGFAPCHEYISTAVTDLNAADPRLARVRARLLEEGIAWRSVDLHCFEEELKKIYRLSLTAFQKNILYTEIDESAFLGQYLHFADSIDPAYMLLAHDASASCCGFVFAIPDLLQRQGGGVVDRLVIKTLAVNPQRKYAGLGAVLVDAIQRTAGANGFKSAIHALMYAGNISTNIGRNSTLLRRYTLYRKALP